MPFQVALRAFAFAPPRPGSRHWTCSIEATLTQGSIAEGQFLGLAVAGVMNQYIIARLYRGQPGGGFEPTPKTAEAGGAIKLELRLTPERYEALAAALPEGTAAEASMLLDSPVPGISR